MLTLKDIEKEQGFTLIELLVVILIIGILAAIAIPMFLNQRKAAAEASVKSDLKNAGTILEGQGKFTGTLPADVKTSNGVTLTAMRTADRDNKIGQSSQFADGNSSGWGTFVHASSVASVSTQLFTDTGDGYQGMNYRRITINSGSNNQVGQVVGMDLPETGVKGQTYSVGAAMRHNYTGCRNINIEFKSGAVAFAGGISTKNVCFTKDTWTYFEHTGTMTGDGANRVAISLYGPMTAGQNFDVTGAVLVKGDKIDSAAALSSTGYDFCLQAYHESDTANVWRYSSLDGGLENKSC